MKIVYVYDCLSRFGGVERIWTEKMNYLAEVYGYEVYLITSNQGSHPDVFPLSPKVKHIDLGVNLHLQYKYKYPKRLWKKWQFNRLFKKKLSKVIAQIVPDIIIATPNFKADVVCQLKCKAKKIIESHCAKLYTGKNDGIYRAPIINYFYQINLARCIHIIEKKSDVLVTLTQGDALEWKKAKTRVIPNMTIKTSDSVSNCETKRVICVGRLHYQKGFDRMIKVWQTVSIKHPDWTLDIFGKGELEGVLKKQIKQLHLENSISIHTPTNEIFKEMQNSSIYALSSNYEGFALVLIEASLNGLPCVSFNCPYGASDIIEDGKNGFLIPNGDIQAMADKICWLIENEEERKEMGRNARLSAMRYAPENIMPQWEKLFNEIVKS